MLSTLSTVRRIEEETADLTSQLYFLQENPLTGPIPPELGNLSNLTRLNVSYTGVSGPIPAELSGLKKLKYLSLRNTSLDGFFPPEAAAMANLSYAQFTYRSQVNRLKLVCSIGLSLKCCPACTQIVQLLGMISMYCRSAVAGYE